MRLNVPAGKTDIPRRAADPSYPRTRSDISQFSPYRPRHSDLHSWQVTPERVQITRKADHVSVAGFDPTMPADSAGDLHQHGQVCWYLQRDQPSLRCPRHEQGYRSHGKELSCIPLEPLLIHGPKVNRRVEGYIIILRAVVTTDFMTAEAYDFDMTFLKRVSTRIVNEVDDVSCVTLNVTSKPPSTIEMQ
jgi:GMP synthase PP-ATPase subunit